VFNPSQEEVRRFFCTLWRKHREASPLTPLEAMALDWILEHPEYQPNLADEEAAVRADYSVENGQTNPFLHLSMHLAVAEQVSIDQPPGIKVIFEQLSHQHNSLHEAAHQIMESLGEVVWESQRTGLPPNTDRYLDSMRRRLTPR
jgi:Domain of unknown function (DUF1841)